MSLWSDVDARFGTARGNCLPGPYLPHALVRHSPDVEPPMPTHGYRPGVALKGFSHTHVAGTGGNSRYGNISVLPFRERPVPALPYEEKAEVGLYSCVLNGIRCELTTTRHAGVHRYSAAEGPIGLWIDVASAIQNQRQPVAACGGSIGGWIAVSDKRRLSGRADLQGG